MQKDRVENLIVIYVSYINHLGISKFCFRLDISIVSLK